MKKKDFRCYEVKKIYPANIARSLNGALSGSFDKMVVLGIQTKSGHLPQGFEQSIIPAGGCYFECRLIEIKGSNIMVGTDCFSKGDSRKPCVLKIPVKEIKYLTVTYFAKEAA